MGEMDQNEIDALLNQIQEQTADMRTQVDTAAESVAQATADMASVGAGPGALDQIAGDMDPPPAKTGTDGLAGEFDAPGAKAAATPLAGGDVRRLLAIEVPVIVLLGQRRMTVGEVMRLGVGAIVEFSKSADEELDLLANNKAIGRGQAVKVGENFGIRLTRVGDVRETIRKLGSAATE